VDKAMGYLIGEKFLNFLQASDGHPEFAAELPRFVEAIKEIFEPGEIRAYLDGTRRVGALGHTASDEEYEEFQGEPSTRARWSGRSRFCGSSGRRHCCCPDPRQGGRAEGRPRAGVRSRPGRGHGRSEPGNAGTAPGHHGRLPAPPTSTRGDR
jgi:hypothetical protein